MAPVRDPRTRGHVVQTDSTLIEGSAVRLGQEFDAIRRACDLQLARRLAELG